MVPAVTAPASRERRPAVRATTARRAAFGLLGVLLVGYAVSLPLRPAGSHWTWLDGWLVDGIELAGALLCLARGLTRRQRRGAVIALGAGLLAWGIGDSILTVQSIGGAIPPTPSWPDVAYLCYYPLVYAAIAMLLRADIHRVSAPNWLDGLVAGLGAATVCAGFVFHGVIRLAGTNPAATITSLAYPIGDLVLLGLVIGAATIVGGGRNRIWLLLAAGLGLNVLGDTVNLLVRSLGASAAGSFIDGVAWPTSIVLVSALTWLPARPPDPFALRRQTSLVVAQLAAGSALAVLVVGTLRPINRTALVLATLTLLTAGLRLVRSSRGLRTLSQERQRLAVTDELTGLANRRRLFGALDTFFSLPPSGAAGRQLAFLFVDLNDFKEINDSFGHPCGDDLLRQLGPRLAASLRRCDLLVRHGGDEFAVVLVDADEAYATEVAQRLTASLEEPFQVGELRMGITASIGIAMAPSQAANASDLLRHADVAMYRAKAEHSPWTVYREDVDTESRLRSAGELRSAIERGRLVLHYQPQLNLRRGEIEGVEALIRWVHPRLGLLAPETFLPVAEDAGLMRLVTNFVLEEALSQCAAWRVAGRNLAVSVNVSPTNLLEAGFVDLVRHLLKRSGVPPEALVIEITETCIFTEFERSRLVIEELRDLGLIVSIDDFGSGFTSLAHLGRLAVGELKLDRIFVGSLTGPNRPRDLELVRATINLAHAMGLRVVIEGVEDGPTLDLMAQYGCDVAQGYFVSRPQPADELFTWLRARPVPTAVRPAESQRAL